MIESIVSCDSAAGWSMHAWSAATARKSSVFCGEGAGGARNPRSVDRVLKSSDMEASGGGDGGCCPMLGVLEQPGRGDDVKDSLPGADERRRLLMRVRCASVNRSSVRSMDRYLCGDGGGGGTPRGTIGIGEMEDIPS